MVELSVGDEVKISMPRGKNLRGVPGVHMMFTTSPEAKFDGGTGVVTEINPRGPQGIPLFLVVSRELAGPDRGSSRGHRGTGTHRCRAAQPGGNQDVVAAPAGNSDSAGSLGPTVAEVLA
jgi:hypothetical protein